MEEKFAREKLNEQEDKIRQMVDSWTPEEQAIAYSYLFACGMTLDRAKAIRRKAGFIA